ncbi:MAG: MEDS domain-containing protein [Nitrospirae bacterium]|nr:MEDS domain-containing protein [Nitrospirota bacterium]
MNNVTETSAHICLLYKKPEEQFKVIMPFIRNGLESGEQCIYICNDNSIDCLFNLMEEGGVDAYKAVKSDALIVITAQEAYLQGGRFSPDFMLRFLDKAIISSKNAGFKRLRGAGEATWSVDSNADMELLIEYEAKVNYIFERNDVVALCQYNIGKFSPEVLIDMLYTHPMVMYDNVMRKNFYYIPPDEYLETSRGSLTLERMLLNLASIETTIHERAKNVLESIIDELRDKLLKVDGIPTTDEKPPMNPNLDKIKTLTKREIEILRLIAKGLTKTKIADILNINDNTVTLHNAHIMRKLSLNRTIDLVLFAINNL